MPGAAFAVNSIELEELNQLYIIKLRLCDDEEIQKGSHKKNIFKGDRDTVRELFNNMGDNTIVRECSDLDQLYNYMMKLFSSDELIELEYFHAMGSKKFSSKDFESSIYYYKGSLTLRKKILPLEYKEIAELHYLIAESYYRWKNYDQAIDFYHEAIDCNSLHPLKAIRAHVCTGYSYLKRDDWNNYDDISSAKNHLQKALDMDLENETLEDGDIVDIYRALIDINIFQDNLDPALNYYTLALEICERNEWTDESNEIKEQIQAIKCSEN
ncbi:unnamed protein product [Rotaria sordida]|uniref:Tetratricopeptide repeat protein n=1 Tax=Rotaria sordida TaxID=392033 RepID=A0A814TZ38_9BILA|nr:unnamed protein product [Rotaria sordida]CAF4183888.1 unnamed protein product [Rotaria sordida]